MALQAAVGNPPSNPIKYSQIIAEFGSPTNTNAGLGEFRVSESIGSFTGQSKSTDSQKTPVSFLGSCSVSTK